MLIERAEDLFKLKERFYTPAVTGTDCETTGLDPYTSELRLLQFAKSADDKRDAIAIDVRKVGKEATREFARPILEDPKIVKVLHNAKFDAKFIKHHLDLEIETVFDSYIASELLEGGLKMPKGYHGLGQVADRIAGIKLSKDEQRSDWSGELSYRQIEYALNDARTLLPVRLGMVEKLKHLKLIRVAKLEFDAVMPMAWLELCGFYLNMDCWTGLSRENLRKAEEVAQKIYKLLEKYLPQGNLFGEVGINLDSIGQVNKYFRMAGVPMPDSTKAEFLNPLADQYELVKLLLEYRDYNKAGTAFGENFMEFVNPVTGRIHAEFKQLGAETGRMSCNKPNLQQIPADPTTRGCFQAEEGKTLLSKDYSQIELRILADLARDRNAMEAFASGVDYHTAMAHRAFKVELDAVTPEQRTFAKRLNFGIPYGIGVKSFAAKAGLSVPEAQEIVEAYFKAVPSEKRWLNYQKVRILETKYTRSASGRIGFFPFDDAIKEEMAAAQRNACNFPIQATSADITKRAMRLVYDGLKQWRRQIKMVNVVHDEMNFEVPVNLVPVVEPIIHKGMIEAAREFILECEVKVDTKVSNVWKK